MQNYSFAKGVKGMVAMAAQAVKMRADVSEILGMADKFYQPEAAIEAAANLQLLGGDIAKAFGDPFETMYLARNKPEELANRVAKMTENMMTFNKVTGEFDMPAEARMQLQAVSKELGLSETSMIKMARQASKIKTIKIDVAGDIKDEKIRESIAGMARMKDGKWTVDFTDQQGKRQTKAIEDLTNLEAKRLVDLRTEQDKKSEKDLLSEIAINTQTFTDRMKNMEESTMMGFVGEADVYTLTMEGFLKDSMNLVESMSTNMMVALNKKLGEGFADDKQGMKEFLQKTFGVKPGGGSANELSTLDELIQNTYGGITNAINKSMEAGMKGLNVKDLRANVDNVLITAKGLGEGGDVMFDGKGPLLAGPEGSLMLSRNDDVLWNAAKGTGVAMPGITNPGVSNFKGGASQNVTHGPIQVVGKIQVVGETGVLTSIDGDKLKKIISDSMSETTENGGVPSNSASVNALRYNS